MVNLSSVAVSYLIIPSNIDSYLYPREYNLFEINTIYKDRSFKYTMGISETITNEELRKDCLEILNSSNIDDLIVKYIGESQIKRIFKNGEEIPLDIIKFNTDPNYMSYIIEDVSFSFIPAKQYQLITKKEELKSGMIVEYLTNDKDWVEKRVVNLDSEYEKLYKLLIKYKRVRVRV